LHHLDPRVPSCDPLVVVGLPPVAPPVGRFPARLDGDASFAIEEIEPEPTTVDRHPDLAIGLRKAASEQNAFGIGLERCVMRAVRLPILRDLAQYGDAFRDPALEIREQAGRRRHSKADRSIHSRLEVDTRKDAGKVEQRSVHACDRDLVTNGSLRRSVDAGSTNNHVAVAVPSNDRG
jgi:hypothetical protein